MYCVPEGNFIDSLQAGSLDKYLLNTSHSKLGHYGVGLRLKLRSKLMPSPAFSSSGSRAPSATSSYDIGRATLLAEIRKDTPASQTQMYRLNKELRRSMPTIDDAKKVRNRTIMEMRKSGWLKDGEELVS